MRVALGLAAGPAPDRFLVALAALSLLSRGGRGAGRCSASSTTPSGSTAPRPGARIRRPAAAGRVGRHGVRGARATSATTCARGPAGAARPRPRRRRRARPARDGHRGPARRGRARPARVGGARQPARAARASARRTRELAGGFALPDAGALPRQIEAQYLRRLRGLPEATQRLMLLAAADPVGDPTLLGGRRRRSGSSARGGAGGDAGCSRSARACASGIRSCARRCTAPPACRPARRPPRARRRDRPRGRPRPAGVAPRARGRGARRGRGRRARPRPAARSARGGIAAAAAFLERAVALTPDPGERAARALAAARAKFAAGDLASAEALLASADGGPARRLRPAQVQRVRAQIAFELRRGRDAPPLLLRAAQRLEPLDSELAAETYLEALMAAIYAGPLANAGDGVDVARAARAAPAGAEPPPAEQLLLLGLATRLIDGYAAAAPALPRRCGCIAESPGRLALGARLHRRRDGSVGRRGLVRARVRAGGARALDRDAELAACALTIWPGTTSRPASSPLRRRSPTEAPGSRRGHPGPGPALHPAPARSLARRRAGSAGARRGDDPRRRRPRRGLRDRPSPDYATAILYNGLGQYERAR